MAITPVHVHCYQVISSSEIAVQSDQPADRKRGPIPSNRLARQSLPAEVAATLGLPGTRIVAVEHPLGGTDEAGVIDRADSAVEPTADIHGVEPPSDGQTPPVEPTLLLLTGSPRPAPRTP